MKSETYTEIENYFKQFFETEDIETKTISGIINFNPPILLLEDFFWLHFSGK